MQKEGWEWRDELGQEDQFVVRNRHCGANDILLSPKEGGISLASSIHGSQANYQGLGTGFPTSLGSFAELS